MENGFCSVQISGQIWKNNTNIFVIDIAWEPIPWKKSVEGGAEQTAGSWTHTRWKCKFTWVFTMISLFREEAKDPTDIFGI